MWIPIKKSRVRSHQESSQFFKKLRVANLIFQDGYKPSNWLIAELRRPLILLEKLAGRAKTSSKPVSLMGYTVLYLNMQMEQFTISQSVSIPICSRGLEKWQICYT